MIEKLFNFFFIFIEKILKVKKTINLKSKMFWLSLLLVSILVLLLFFVLLVYPNLVLSIPTEGSGCPYCNYKLVLLILNEVKL